MTARRAWLFADTPKGAPANQLNIYEYLDYLLKVMPNTDYNNYPEKLDAYLP